MCPKLNTYRNMKYIKAILFLILPSFILRIIFKGINGRIGFSIVFADELVIEKNASIGHLNLLLANRIVMKEGARIKFLCAFKGVMNVILKEHSTIGKQNKISNLLYNDKITTFELGKKSTVSCGSFIDLSRDVIIGDNSCLAGIGTQVFTHSFMHQEGEPNTKVMAPVYIGKNVYIGTRCIITSNVRITDNVVVGAGVTVSRSIIEPGTYVQAPLVKLQIDVKEKLKKMHKISDYLYEKITPPLSTNCK